MGTVMDGLAFGTGSAIAHRAVGAVFGSMGGGSSTAPAPAVAAAAPQSANNSSSCDSHQQEFTQCLKLNRNDIASCQMYMDNFQQCTSDSRLN